MSEITIRQVQNGYIVVTQSPRQDYARAQNAIASQLGSYSNFRERVFATFAEVTEYIRDQFCEPIQHQEDVNISLLRESKPEGTPASMPTDEQIAAMDGPYATPEMLAEIGLPNTFHMNDDGDVTHAEISIRETD